MLTKEALQEAYEIGAQQALEDAGLTKAAYKYPNMKEIGKFTGLAKKTFPKAREELGLRDHLRLADRIKKVHRGGSPAKSQPKRHAPGEGPVGEAFEPKG